MKRLAHNLGRVSAETLTTENVDRITEQWFHDRSPRSRCLCRISISRIYTCILSLKNHTKYFFFINCLAFQSFAFEGTRWRLLRVPDEGYWGYPMKVIEGTRWRLLRKHVMHTTLDIYVFVFTWSSTRTRQKLCN
jgi:hypothetical protein